MALRRRSYAVCGLILVASGCAGRCGRTSPPPPRSPPDASDDAGAPADAAAPVLGGLEHSFQPLDVGDTWTYETKQSGTMALTTTSVERIVSVERGIDRVVARVTDTQSVGGGSTERSIVLVPLGISPDIGTMRSPFVTVKTMSTTGVYLPIDVATAGKKWSYTQELSTTRVQADLESLGVETIVVPAGEHRAAHVKSRIRSSGHVQDDESWFAPGVGLVKSVQTTPAGYRAEKVLLRFEHGAR